MSLQYKTTTSSHQRQGLHMKFPAQEVILGALLMLGAFAIGTMRSSAGASPADEFMHKLGEFLTAVATIGLVVVTYLLFKATTLLARSAKEDSRNRKIQATADAWIKLRTELTNLPNLRKLDTAAVKVEGKKAVPELRKLESFSQVVNSDVYDLETFKVSRPGNFTASLSQVGSRTGAPV
jgi:hypothetical protein